MGAFLAKRVYSWLWNSFVIAGLLVESWIISINIVQPGQVEIAAEEASPLEVASEEASPLEVAVEEERPHKKGSASESFDKVDNEPLPNGCAGWADKGALVESSPLKGLNPPNPLS